MHFLPKIQMVFLYYDNPLMLAEQINCWNSYVGVLRALPEVLLIDDGSPKTPAANIVHGAHRKIPIKVFRIKEDIPWNFSGARNLGCVQANEWIYVSDIDTLLPAEDATNFFEGAPLDRECIYIPRRIYLPSRQEAPQALVNLLFHKEKYLTIGGYDEDYAGHYGREETDFFNRLKLVANFVRRQDVTVQVANAASIPDARTEGLSRDRTRNIALYEKKLAEGFKNPSNPLRFSWERVL